MARKRKYTKPFTAGGRIPKFNENVPNFPGIFFVSLAKLSSCFQNTWTIFVSSGIQTRLTAACDNLYYLPWTSKTCGTSLFRSALYFHVTELFLEVK